MKIITSIIILTACITVSAQAETKLEVVASVISAEASGDGELGLYAVGCVIMNRCEKYNKTPYEVVTAKSQFSGYTAKNRLLRYSEVKENADFLADNIMYLTDITGGALYFKTEREKLKPWHKVKTFEYRNHVFYK